MSDRKLIRTYNNTAAAHGLILLRSALYLDLVRDAVAFSLDKDEQAASLRNVLRLLSQKDLRDELRRMYCAPRPTEWIGDDNIDEQTKRLIEEQRREAFQEQRSKDFDRRYSKLQRKADKVFRGELATRLKKGRDQMIAHYQMTGSEPRSVKPEDLGLKWSDAGNYFRKIEPLIFDAELLISNASYALGQYKENSRRVAREFWNTRKRGRLARRPA